MKLILGKTTIKKLLIILFLTFANLSDVTYQIQLLNPTNNNKSHEINQNKDSSPRFKSLNLNNNNKSSKFTSTKSSIKAQSSSGNTLSAKTENSKTSLGDQIVKVSFYLINSLFE